MIYLFGLITIIVAFELCKYIRKNASSKIVSYIYYLIIYNCFIKFFIGYLNIPSFFNYFSDVLFVVILACYFMYLKKGNHFKTKTFFKISVVFYIVVCILSYVFNLYSPYLFIWGIRNNIKYVMLAYICCCTVKKEDLKLLYPVLLSFFMINFFLVLYQYFFMEYNQLSAGDFMSGLYSNGELRGGNASLCWLMCMGTSYSLASFLHKKLSIKHVALWVICSIIIAALNETKIFFIDLLLISLITIILSQKSIKSVIYIVLGVAAMSVGIRMLYYYNPNFADFFNEKAIYEYTSNPYIKGGMSRMTAIEYSYNNYLTSRGQRLFGLGLGNADYSSAELFTSNFYLKNSYNGYIFFSSAMVIIETGVFGLISYLLLFISPLIIAIFTTNHSSSDKIYRIFSINALVLCIVSFFSNQLLRLEASAYLIYFIVSIPIILKMSTNMEVKHE